MSKNSRFNEDFSYIMLIVSLLTVFSVLFIKLTYLVALPFFYPRDDPLRDIHIYEKIVPVLQLIDFSRCGKNVMHDL